MKWPFTRNTTQDLILLPFIRQKKKKKSGNASFNRRMLAATIDSLVLMFLSPVFDRLAPINRSGVSDLMVAPESEGAALHILAALLSDKVFVHSWLNNFTMQITFYLIYCGVCWYVWQATLGKMMMRMRIVDAATGGPVSPQNIALRLAGYIFSATCCMLGFFWISISKDNRGWHDYLAGTKVVVDPWKLKRPTPQPTETKPTETKPDETPAD